MQCKHNVWYYECYENEAMKINSKIFLKDFHQNFYQ